MLVFQDVTKAYPTRQGTVHALQDLSLRVGDGEYVAVCGPSGSGKSTLLSLAGGLAAPTAGTVAVAGQDLAALSGARRAAFRGERIGFVFQMFHLLPYLSVVDNVRISAAGEDAQRRAEELLRQFGLGDRLLHRPGQLSAGERQRTAMARAMVNEPQLLLADEPTGNLDPDNAAVVLDLVDEYHRSGGTVLMVTHQRDAAARAERIVTLEAGRMAAAAV